MAYIAALHIPEYVAPKHCSASLLPDKIKIPEIPNPTIRNGVQQKSDLFNSHYLECNVQNPTKLFEWVLTFWSSSAQGTQNFIQTHLDVFSIPFKRLYLTILVLNYRRHRSRKSLCASHEGLLFALSDATDRRNFIHTSFRCHFWHILLSPEIGKTTGFGSSATTLDI